MNDNSLVDMGFTGERFPVGTHMCLIFNSEAERKKIITKYIKSGILSGQKVTYLADNATKPEIWSWLEDIGVDLTSENVRTHFEVIEAEKVYCSGGYFSPDKMLDALKDFHRGTHAAGYPSLRASGEMTWALKGIPGSDRLIEYESRLNDLVESHPFTALCQYDAARFDGDTIFNVLQVHPLMVVKGQILRNPYYMTPKEFLARPA